MQSPLLLVPAHAEAVRVVPAETTEGTVRLPGSKSITNRMILLASVARGTSFLRNTLECDDSRHLIEALGLLGVVIRKSPLDGVLSVVGSGGPFPVKEGSFFLGNAGTACRFLTAALAATGGRYVVDGDPRMRERPIGELVRALADLGAEISCPTGCPPVYLGPRAMSGGMVDVPGGTSSQFISALLMAGPIIGRRVDVRVTKEIVSRPYLDITLACMHAFGVRTFVDDRRGDGVPIFEVPSSRGYVAADQIVEGDASAAGYFWAAAAVTGGTVRVEGVGKESLQGDARILDVLAAMGARVKKEREAATVTGALLKGIDCDCSDIPDSVPTLAVVAVFARGRTRLRGVPHLRHKESDRIASVATELRKLGVKVRELPDGLEIEGTLGPEPAGLAPAVIETWGDHRLAMAFSVASLVVPGLVIRSPQVVSKSYPGFFGALAALGPRVEFLPEGPGARPLPGAAP